MRVLLVLQPFWPHREAEGVSPVDCGAPQTGDPYVSHGFWRPRHRITSSDPERQDAVRRASFLWVFFGNEDCG